MVKIFYFLIVRHVQCYLSPIKYSNSRQTLIVCPTVGSTLPLFDVLMESFSLLTNHMAAIIRKLILMAM